METSRHQIMNKDRPGTIIAIVFLIVLAMIAIFLLWPGKNKVWKTCNLKNQKSHESQKMEEFSGAAPLIRLIRFSVQGSHQRITVWETDLLPVGSGLILTDL